MRDLRVGRGKFVCLLLATAAAGSMSGQVLVGIASSKVSGVHIHDTSSPQFRQHVAASLAPRSVLERAGSLLTRSVIVENRTGRDIRSITVRFDGTNSKGRPAYRIETIRDLDPRIPPRFKNASQMLISMHSDVTYAFLSGRYERIDATGPSIASEIQIFESFRGMIASIDSVIFADGRFEGPDVSREFDRITATIQAQRELAAELRAITSTGDEKRLRQHLDAIAAHKDFAHPAGPVDRRDVRSREASLLLGLLSRNGILQVAQVLQSTEENLGKVLIRKESEQ